MKRIIALMMALCLVISTFAACGKQIDNNDPPAHGTGDQPGDKPPVNQDDDNDIHPDDGTWNGYDIGFVYDNGIEYIWNQLDDDVKANFAVTMNAIKNVELTCKPPVAMTTDEERTGFFTLVYYCCTAYSYVDTKFFYSDTDGDGVRDTIILPYNYDVIAVEQDGIDIYNELDAKLNEIVSAMPDGSEYEKIRYLHDYLIFNSTYSENAILPFTAYGALVEQNATCQGYANAMHLLLQRAGFETCFVVGRGDRADVTHKWNYVRLSDGKWYVLDPTWADPTGKDDPDYINYDYFLISDEVLLQDHLEKFDNAYYNNSYYYDIPVADSMDMSFHMVEGYYATSVDEAREIIKKQVAQCAQSGKKYVYLRISEESVYEEIRTAILTNAEVRSQIFAEANADYAKWSVYRAHKDGFGPLTFVLTLRMDGE